MHFHGLYKIIRYKMCKVEKIFVPWYEIREGCVRRSCHFLLPVNRQKTEGGYDLFLNSQSILLFTEVTQFCYHGCSTRMIRWYCFSNTSANLEAMRKEIHYKSYELYLFSSKKLSLDRRAHRKVSLTCSWQQDSWPPSTRVKWYTFTSTFSWIYNVS